jgi:hypothetical protein
VKLGAFPGQLGEFPNVSPVFSAFQGAESDSIWNLYWNRMNSHLATDPLYTSGQLYAVTQYTQQHCLQIEELVIPVPNLRALSEPVSCKVLRTARSMSSLLQNCYTDRHRIGHDGSIKTLSPRYQKGPKHPRSREHRCSAVVGSLPTSHQRRQPGPTWTQMGSIKWEVPPKMDG